MYFDQCSNLNELKSTYKKLALKHHPDMGGNIRDMQAINAEYDRVFALLKDVHNREAARPDSKVRTTTEAPEEFRTVVDMLLKIQGIEIELCGAWLWISGKTYENREALKSCGCLFSKSKRKWYWRHAENGARWSRGYTSMAQIRAKYGSEYLRKADDRNKLPA